MSNWTSKPQEIKNLFNPAFCGWILFEVVKSFHSEKGEGMPTPLFFLILPLVLHKKTRESLPARKNSNLRLWTSENASIMIDFGTRAQRMKKISYLALSQMIVAKKLKIENSKIVPSGSLRGVNSLKSLSTEISEIQKKTLFMGKWLAHSGHVASIYTSFGVRP